MRMCTVMHDAPDARCAPCTGLVGPLLVGLAATACLGWGIRSLYARARARIKPAPPGYDYDLAAAAAQAEATRRAVACIQVVPLRH